MKRVNERTGAEGIKRMKRTGESTYYYDFSEFSRSYPSPSWMEGGVLITTLFWARQKYPPAI